MFNLQSTIIDIYIYNNICRKVVYMTTFDCILETSLIYNDMLHFNIIIDCTF